MLEQEFGVVGRASAVRPEVEENPLPTVEGMRRRRPLHGGYVFYAFWMFILMNLIQHIL